MIQCDCVEQMTGDNLPCDVHGMRRTRGAKIKLGLIPSYNEQFRSKNG